MLRLVIFDLDGTVVEQKINFAALRSEIGAPKGKPILEYIESLPEKARPPALKILHRHEETAARNCSLQPGLLDILEFLRKRGLVVAVFTRNSRASLRTVLERHHITFDAEATREDAPPKPSPEPVLFLCQRLAVKPSETLVVGDYEFDIASGHAAGARTVHLVSELHPSTTTPSDYKIRSLDELRPIVERLIRAS